MGTIGRYLGTWLLGVAVTAIVYFTTRTLWGLFGYYPCAALLVMTFMRERHGMHKLGPLEGENGRAQRERNRTGLLSDPAVWDMADEMRAAWDHPESRTRMVHGSGWARFDFMNRCAEEYGRRSAEPAEVHHGCASEAIVMILAGSLKRDDYLEGN